MATKRKTAIPQKSQMQMYHESEQRLFAANDVFMQMVNCKTNPLTRESLQKCIDRFPERWTRFSGFLDKLPSEKDV